MPLEDFQIFSINAKLFEESNIDLAYIIVTAIRNKTNIDIYPMYYLCILVSKIHRFRRLRYVDRCNHTALTEGCRFVA